MFTDENGDGKPLPIIATVIFVIGLIVAFTGIEFVNSGEIGIVTRYGKIEESVGEGGYYYNPLTVDVNRVSIKTEKKELDIQAGSKDLQTISLKLAVNYNVARELAVELYKTVGENFVDKLLLPMVNEQTKSVVAKYTAEELITKREEVKTAVVTSIKEKATLMSINVSDVSLVDVDYSPAFNAAIETKVKAEQEALTAKNVLQRIEYEAKQQVAQAQGAKDSSILKAQGEAEAIKIQSQAIKAQGGAEYVKLKWIEKWNGALPTTQLAEGATTMINLK